MNKIVEESSKLDKISELVYLCSGVIDYLKITLGENMARITIEDCLENVDNRFALVMVTADRAKKLLKKDVQPLIEDHRDNREVVTALREIAQGEIQAVKAKEVVEVEVNSDVEDAANLTPILPDAAKLA